MGIHQGNNMVTQEKTMFNTTDDRNRLADRTLFVLLHGLHSSAKRLEGIRKVTTSKFKNCEILTFELPLRLWSFTAPLAIVVDIMDRIDSIWKNAANNGRPFSRLIFIGHSMGALLARKVYACAWGELAGASVEHELLTTEEAEAPNVGGMRHGERLWAQKTERLILLSGISRGWAVSSAMSHSERAAWALYAGIGHLIPKWKSTIFGFRKGAPFLTEIRLQWLAMRREIKVADALVIQLLGTVDDLVPPQDYLDVSPNGSTSSVDLLYLQVDGTGHANIIDVDYIETGGVHNIDAELQNSVIHGRRKALICALVDTREKVTELALHASDFDDNEPSTPNENVTDVLFVMHGIRDKGFWTKKLAQHVKAKARDTEGNKVVRAITATYGYFGMGPFAVPWYRQFKVEWLMDRYVEARALYPGEATRFHYIGHSNGTYLLASALHQYPSCQFTNVIFVGSVVPKDYNWVRSKGKDVAGVWNFVANRDWVVAILAKGVRRLTWQWDIGSAGFDGFEVEEQGPVENLT